MMKYDETQLTLARHLSWVLLKSTELVPDKSQTVTTGTLSQHEFVVAEEVGFIVVQDYKVNPILPEDEDDRGLNIEKMKHAISCGLTVRFHLTQLGCDLVTYVRL